jgi:hypothetical protein
MIEHDNIFDLAQDRLQTFHRILTSKLMSLGYIVDNPNNMIVSGQPKIVEDTEDDVQFATAEILNFEFGTFSNIGKVKWEADLVGRLNAVTLTLMPQPRRRRGAMTYTHQIKLIDTVIAAIVDTLNNLRMRGILKASREDLVAQLYRTSRIEYSENFSQAIGRPEGAAVDQYFNERANFNVRGGRKGRKTRSKKQSKTRVSTKRRTQ